MVGNDRGLRALAWTGPLSIVLVLVGWIGAGFFPPPSPSLSGDAVLQLWRTDTAVKQLSMIVCIWGGALYAPFSVAVYFALRRSGEEVLALAQAVLGVFGTVFFTLNFFVLSMVAFRIDEGGAYVQTLHDLGFAMTFEPVAPFTMQYILIAVAVLRSDNPYYPRWVGYANAWIGLLLVPACLIPLFRSGPLAWNGVFSFWIPVLVFVAWFFVMFVPIARAPVRAPDAPAPAAL